MLGAMLLPLAAPQAVAQRFPCPNQQGSTKSLLHTRSAAAAAVCAQESAASSGASAASSNSSSSPGGGNNSSSRHPYEQQQEARHSITQPYGGAPAAARVAAPGPKHAVAFEAALSSQMQKASSWNELVTLLLNYSSTAKGGSSVSNMPHTRAPSAAALASPQQAAAMQQQQRRQKMLQHARQQQQQQQAEAVLSTLHQLNSKHLARLLKALVRLQPPQQQQSSTPLAPAAAAARQPAGVMLSKQEQQLFWALAQAAFSECMEQLSLSAWELSSTLWAASKLAHPPPPFLLRRLLQQLVQPGVLAAASAQDISMSLHAVASLAVQVPEQQLEVLLAASAQHMQAASPQALANTLWAVATLQHKPQEQWIRQLEQRCASIMLDSSPPQQRHLQQQHAGGPSLHSDLHSQQQQQQPLWYPSRAQHPQQQQQLQGVRQEAFTAHGLYQLVWSLAKLQWQPTASFQAGFWSASLSQLPSMTPHGTSGVLWAAASLGLQPPEPWQCSWLAELQGQMQQGGCGPQDCANALWAVVRLGMQPGEGWVQVALRTSRAVLRAAGTQELSNTLWAFAKLGVRPDAAWMHSWLEAMQPRMGSYCAPALACSAYGLAVLKFRPPRAWTQTLLFETQRQMPAFGAQELCNLLWALAVLGLRPGADWFRDFEVQAVHEAGSFNAQELSVIFWAMAKLQHTPPAAWVAGLLREGLEVAGGLQAQSLVLLMGALTRWQLPQMHTKGHYRVLLPRYWAAAEQLLPDCSLRYLSVLYAARTKLGVLPSRQWSRSFWKAVRARLLNVNSPTSAQQPALTADGIAGSAYSATSSSSTSSGPGHQWKQQQTAVAGLPVSSAGGAVEAHVVSQLVWAAGKLWVQGPAPGTTLRLLLAAAVAAVPQCSFGELTAIAIGVRHILQQKTSRRAVLRVHRKAVGAVRRGGMPASRFAAQPAVLKLRQGHSSSSSNSSCRLVRVKGRTSRELQQLAHPLWKAWFSRSTQLLQQQQQQASTANWQQQQQVLLNCRHVSHQLRVVSVLRLRPPSAWLQAVLAVLQAALASSTAEVLSWVLLDLSTLLQCSTSSSKGVQLPEGFVSGALHRAAVLHAEQEGAGWTPAQMLRLQSAVRRLKACGCVGAVKWQQWQRLLVVWKASQGLRLSSSS